MQILYDSTRGGETGIRASQAVLNGLARDGGLYVPSSFPKLDVSLGSLAEMDYREVAFQVMKLFLTDYTEEELRCCITHAYDDKFDVPEIAPLHQADGSWFLELFHGRTIAFKDMALSILPYLMTTAAKKNQIKNEICILTATSGDTGKAAMAGFADVPGTQIIVFFPKDGVSPVQKRQMVTQKGENTHVVAINGNFDDAQTGVKKLFGDRELEEEMDRHGIQFSSANSINIGRLVPQAAYYVYAYSRLVKAGKIQAGDPINVTVPTGNFGNILAAYYAKQTGLPIRKLICASNENKVLFDFFSTGIYDKNRPFILTSSPSMDILVSSNLERLIYLICGEDSEKTKELMEELKTTGKYTITPEMKEKLADFAAGYSTEEETAESIHDTYQKTGYVMDTHTAVAAHVCGQYRAKSGDQTKCVIASTASPYKFVKSVMSAIDAENANADEFDLLPKLQEVSGVPMPQAIKDILDAKVLHDLECDADKMKDTVKGILGV